MGAHVRKCPWTVLGARVTWATWTERPGNMNSGVHRVDMATLRPGLHQTRRTWGPCPKVWPPCSFSNKEPSKTSVWLPCSGHVQEQKRLPPWLANDSTCGLQGSRLPWGFMLRACLCGVRARVHAGSCREANMTLSDCLCHACLCLCCMRARVCAESGHGAPGRRIRSLWV